MIRQNVSPLNPVIALCTARFNMQIFYVLPTEDILFFYGSQKPKNRYPLHDSPSLVPLLKQINPVHHLQFYCLTIHFNKIPPSRSTSSKPSPSLRFPHQNPVCISLHTRQMPPHVNLPEGYTTPTSNQWQQVLTVLRFRMLQTTSHKQPLLPLI